MHSNIYRLIKRLLAEEKTIALAESMTCGLASHQFTTMKGASQVLKGSVICYTEEVKCGLLGLDPGMIRKHTAESMAVTDAMARRLKALIKADVYAAVTGLASADGTESRNKPVGTVFIAVIHKGKLVHERFVFRGRPLEIRKKACKALYGLAEKAMKE